MSSLKQFLGKPKVVKLKAGEITIYPLRVKDLHLLDQQASPEEKMKATVNLLRKSLRDPSVTEGDIQDMELEVFTVLMDEIIKLNGLENERVRKIKESIARRSTN